MWPKIKLIKALIVVLDICKNDEDPSTMKAQVCSQHYSHYKSMEIFSDVQGATNSIDSCSTLLNFKPIDAFIAVLGPCNNE